MANHKFVFFFNFLLPFFSWVLCAWGLLKAVITDKSTSSVQHSCIQNFVLMSPLCWYLSCFTVAVHLVYWHWSFQTLIYSKSKHYRICIDNQFNLTSANAVWPNLAFFLGSFIFQYCRKLNISIHVSFTFRLYVATACAIVFHNAVFISMLNLPLLKSDFNFLAVLLAILTRALFSAEQFHQSFSCCQGMRSTDYYYFKATFVVQYLSLVGVSELIFMLLRLPLIHTIMLSDTLSAHHKNVFVCSF